MDVISTFIYKYKSLLRRFETFQFPRFLKKIRETERGVDEKELRVPESEINSQESKMEKIGDERGGQTQAMKSQVAIRCAKAAILLSSLKNSPNNSTSNITLKNEEEIEDLKIALVKEKLKNKKLRICVEMELLVFFLWTLLLLVVF
ncbi:uncharacterized protein LOC111376400 [Olea europaea var. sylvestris]|uniref:uncharacterized protein LOC111376400 n=1 Tax=Olea europaea var. sylvestris TaxID=158386 RepID=UPI000C1D2C57|nr:uncharacterized protein LOC111376400 [Olea europaea var. sylvestris]